jgi:predicted esterase
VTFVAAFAAASPLRRPPAVPGERVLVIAGERDRVCSLLHSVALRDHFGGGLVTFPGSHLVQIGRRVVFRSLARFLGRLGIARRG